MVLVENLITNLQQGGMKLILPFLLVFVLLYGILERIDLFGGEDKGGRINAALAVISSLIVIGYTPFVEGVFYAYLTNMFGAISIILTVLLGFYLIAGLSGTKGSITEAFEGHEKKILLGVAAVVVFLFVGYGGPRMIFNPESGAAVGFPYILGSRDVVVLLIIAAIIGFMVWVMGSEDGDGDDE